MPLVFGAMYRWPWVRLCLLWLWNSGKSIKPFRVLCFCWLGLWDMVNTVLRYLALGFVFTVDIFFRVFVQVVFMFLMGVLNAAEFVFVHMRVFMLALQSDCMSVVGI